MELRRSESGIVALIVNLTRRQLQYVVNNQGTVDMFYDSLERISGIYPEKVSADKAALAVAAREFLKAENVTQSARAALLTIIKEPTMETQPSAKPAKKVGVKVTKPTSAGKVAPAAKAEPKKSTVRGRVAEQAAAKKPADKPPFTPDKKPTTKAAAKTAPAKAAAKPAAKTALPTKLVSIRKIDDSKVKSGFLLTFVNAAKKLKSPFTKEDLLKAVASVKETDERKNRYFNYCVKHGIFIV